MPLRFVSYVSEMRNWLVCRYKMFFLAMNGLIGSHRVSGDSRQGAIDITFSPPFLAIFGDCQFAVMQRLRLSLVRIGH